jgi:hypothetical protein
MDQLITEFHQRDYTLIEMLAALALKFGIIMSESKLKRYLKSLNLTKYKNESSFELIVEKMNEELETSGQLLGYRALWKRLKLKYSLNVKRETVQLLLKELDPGGVAARTAKRFKRRKYCVPGPNHIWHVDGYDKLKPYGFPIHGAIDGFSRYLFWLKVRKFLIDLNFKNKI